jgi:small subunit ribosomal protein S15
MSKAAVVKTKTIQGNQRHAKDTGSPEVQVAILTEEIQYLTTHAGTHPHDNHSRKGLMMKVSKRNKLLKYLKSSNPASYDGLIKKLGLRK